MTRALIIDDNAEVAKYLRRILDMLGLEASAAYSVREAMLHVLEDPPDIIFLDIKMPGFDGFEVLRYLKREPRLESVPVCIVSSESQPETVAKAKKMGAMGYIVKPPTVEDFEQILQETRLIST